MVLLVRMTGPAVVRAPLVKLDEAEIRRIGQAMDASGIGTNGARGLAAPALAAE